MLTHTKGPNADDVKICHRFKQTRTESNLSQAKFAKKLDTNSSYIKAIEQQYFLPNFTIIRRWAQRFKKSYSWIIDGKEQKK